MKFITALLLLFTCLISMAQPNPERMKPGTYKLDRTNIEIRNIHTPKDQKARGERVLNYQRNYAKGDQITVHGGLFSSITMDGLKEPVIVYVPSRKAIINIDPKVEDFKGDRHNIKAQIASDEQLLAYRNLAYNPIDWQGNKITFYPHITASSECRGEFQFSARNAINGKTANTDHSGWNYSSWGPEKSNENWLKVDFGRLVKVDQLKLYIRADFPHDGYWQKAIIHFSDGSKEEIKITKDVEAQVFKFAAREITNLKVTFSEAKPANSWCAITEMEVWGHEAFPFELSTSWENVLQSMDYRKGMIHDNYFYWLMLEKAFPKEVDWLMQDTQMNLIDFLSVDKAVRWNALAARVIEQLNDQGVRNKLQSSLSKKNSVVQVYNEACKQRRKEFLTNLTSQYKQFAFVRRYPIVPSFFAYTEGVSDHRYEYHFTPGAQLCKLDLSNGEENVTVLLDDPNGVIRDPDVSFDGKYILFAWKKSLYEDDYHLYEMEIASKEIRQITFGLRHADIEGKYLYNGDIVFNSTRCEQTVDCWRTEVSNLYLVNRNGKYMRRVGFDQVQTTYPTVMEDGRIIYTRWDYNDRGQTFPQPLFVMNPDGTAQTELYGNNSWYPTTMVHARQIPGTSKVMATLCGHHTAQRGQLAIIDPEKGRQEDSGVTLLAPVRKEKPVRIDTYGQSGPQFQFPFPLSEDHFLVSFEPYDTWNRGYLSPYNLYFMNKEGHRELLDAHASLGSIQVVPIAPRKVKSVKPGFVDYTKKTGTYFIQNVYHGEGSKGIKPGTIEKIRVVALDFRAAPVGENHAQNNEGGVRTGNLASTPIALAQGSWDVKKVLGEVAIEKDGSVMFEVPARTPVYFQMIDTAGYVAQTMRSWSTLQPGETFSCIGCHENKNESVPLKTRVQAMAKGVKKLNPFYGKARGFSFREEIQPILNKHCVECHWDRDAKRLNEGQLSVGEYAVVTNWEKPKKTKGKAFSLLDIPVKEDIAKREWNDAYLNLLQAYNIPNGRSFKGSFKSELVNWPGMQSVPTLLPPYYRGSATSNLMKMLKEKHGDVKLSKEELEKIACWIDLQVPYCGDYKEANTWTPKEMEYYDYYLNKRIKHEEEERRNIEEYIQSLK
ncbi:hypothetical protein EYV94_05480 [Puteibacter caeruleilacunae]|nr:hypothetical protein EYV94_05480 [Puteibacter caeruleilacunae]